MVLGQRNKRILHPSKAYVIQKSYRIIEHELLVVVFAFEKFRSYFFGTKVIVHTDHSEVSHGEKYAKLRFIIWVLCLHNF